MQTVPLGEPDMVPVEEEEAILVELVEPNTSALEVIVQRQLDMVDLPIFPAVKEHLNILDMIHAQ